MSWAWHCSFRQPFLVSENCDGIPLVLPNGSVLWLAFVVYFGLSWASEEIYHAAKDSDSAISMVSHASCR